jgi:hypothetical protein
VSPLFISPFVGPVVLYSDLAAAITQLEAPLEDGEWLAALRDADNTQDAAERIIRSRAAAFRLAVGVTPTEEAP